MNYKKTTLKYKAFTMAEAVLVMTILGIIATVMITTIKPARFKEQGYKVLAKSVYASIDTAVTQILVDKAPFNKLDQVYKSGSSTELFNMNESDSSQNEEFIKLLKDYMATARGDIPNVCNKTGYSSILLKNGACIGVIAGTTSEQIETWIPGEESSSQMYLSYGNIFVDINGDDEPNVLGKDQFNIPLNINGIEDGSSGEGVKGCKNDQGIAGCSIAAHLPASSYADSSCTSFVHYPTCEGCCIGYVRIMVQSEGWSTRNGQCISATTRYWVCSKE
ncbi:MAG: hypothetical protein IKR34_03275 [Candidatus Gastranaerophilales bacterium]|nr:hypothetical protein [Candidatus Gastranaerophilales bacterium]